jgi:hypothetical protein
MRPGMAFVVQRLRELASDSKILNALAPPADLLVPVEQPEGMYLHNQLHDDDDDDDEDEEDEEGGNQVGQSRGDGDDANGAGGRRVTHDCFCRSC